MILSNSQMFHIKAEGLWTPELTRPTKQLLKVTLKADFITAAKSPMKQWVKEDREPSIVHRCCATDLGICVIKGDSFSFSMAQEDKTSYSLDLDRT